MKINKSSMVGFVRLVMIMATVNIIIETVNFIKNHWIFLISSTAVLAAAIAITAATLKYWPLIKEKLRANISPEPAKYKTRVEVSFELPHHTARTESANRTSVEHEATGRHSARKLDIEPPAKHEPANHMRNDQQACLSLILWNVQWASKNNKKGKFFFPLFESSSCDIICITEGCADILPRSGYTITSEEDFGYPIVANRRKVILWSRKPWTQVDTKGCASLPGGRFVAGTTEAACGPVRIIGVCIPWRDAHVRSGQRNRQAWQDHLTYLSHLPKSIPACPSTGTILLGDFNQRIPRARQPEHVYTALRSALGSRFNIITAGKIAGTSELSIDHVAVENAFLPNSIKYLCPNDSAGTPMSDHFGLRVELRKKIL